jgi:RimJ/RimL family protein N-acetyltransferase
MKSIEEGYAHLLDIPVDSFHQKNIQLIETDNQRKPTWAKWVVPIWIIRFTASPVCTVSTEYVDVAKQLVEKLNKLDILSPKLLEFAQMIHKENGGWNQREIMIYKNNISVKRHGHKVEQLKQIDSHSRILLNRFDGGVFVIRNEINDIVAYAGVKNKGIIQEIAVKTDPTYQRKGMAQDVVSQAITAILDDGKIPTYIPDSLDNAASYLLAQKLGFDKVGEMIFWEYELPDWSGFIKESLLNKMKNRFIEKVLLAIPPYKR